MNKIIGPLSEDNPLVIDDQNACGFCHKPFKKGERITLLSVASPTGKPQNIRAAPAHARCAYMGAETRKGQIRHIKDGNGSPYPIVTDQGQFTIEEAGLD